MEPFCSRRVAVSGLLELSRNLFIMTGHRAALCSPSYKASAMRSALLPELRSALCALLLNFLLLSPESSLGAAFSSLRAPLCFTVGPLRLGAILCIIVAVLKAVLSILDLY